MQRKFNTNEVFLNQTMQRQKWRTTRDTEEIAAVMTPQNYPIKGMSFFPVKDRFLTTQTSEFK